MFCWIPFRGSVSAYLILRFADNISFIEGCEYFIHYWVVRRCIVTEPILMFFFFFWATSSETAWSPRCAVERIRLEMTKPPPPLSPKLSLHPSLPARWPPLDLYPLTSLQCPICPCTSRDPPPPSSTKFFFWPILLTYLSMCLHCSGTITPLVGLTYWRASMSIFNPFNHGKCSAGFTEFNPASRGCCPCDDPTEHIPGSSLPQNT